MERSVVFMLNHKLWRNLILDYFCDLDYVIMSESVGVGPLIRIVQLGLGTEMTRGAGQGLGSGQESGLESLR